MLPDDLDLQPAQLAHLPLVRVVIDQLGIDDVLNDRLPKDPRARVSDADCVAVMLLNILQGRVALYQMERFLDHIDTDIVLGTGCPADAFNDARLAAALDHLFDAGTDSILSDVVTGYLRSDRAPPSYTVHADTTTIKLFGRYDVDPDEGAPTPAFGFSKDHRPDIKQLLFGLSLHGAAGIPLTAAVLDGNTSDTTANRLNIDQLAELLPDEDDVTLVGDSKLVDAVTLGRALDEGFHVISLVPETFKVRRELIEMVRQGSGEPVELARRPGRVKADPDQVYRGCSFVRPMAIDGRTTGRVERELRFVVVSSDALGRRFDGTLSKKLVAEEKRFMKAFRQLAGTPFTCVADAEKAAAKLRAKLKLHTADLQLVEEEVPVKRSGPGRPRKGEARPTEHQVRLVFEALAPDEALMERARFHARHFVLVTDHVDPGEWSDADVLAAYRHQHLIEGDCGFRWLKNVADVAPVFLKTPRRIAALGLVFVLALMVRNYIQFTIRARLAETGKALPDRKGRPTQHLTTETALMSMSKAAVVLVVLGGRVVQREAQWARRRRADLARDARRAARGLCDAAGEMGRSRREDLRNVRRCTGRRTNPRPASGRRPRPARPAT